MKTDSIGLTNLRPSFRQHDVTRKPYRNPQTKAMRNTNLPVKRIRLSYIEDSNINNRREESIASCIVGFFSRP